jgi:hypothetical protein
MTSADGESPILSNMLTPDLSDCNISLLFVSDDNMPETAGKPEAAGKPGAAGNPVGVLWHEGDLALGRQYMTEWMDNLPGVASESDKFIQQPLPPRKEVIPDCSGRYVVANKLHLRDLRLID